MSSYQSRKNVRGIFLSLATVLIALITISSCSDNVDESNLYVFKGKSAYTFMKNTDDLTSRISSGESKAQQAVEFPFQRTIIITRQLYGFRSQQSGHTDIP